MQRIFITGGTGYMGTRLIRALQSEEYHIRALVRKGSENKLPWLQIFQIATKGIRFFIRYILKEVSFKSTPPTDKIKLFTVDNHTDW